jgi:hypothetical protein
MYAICKNKKLKYNIFYKSLKNDSTWISYTRVFMHTWLLPLQNDLWKKFMNVHVKLYFMMYDVNYHLHFWKVHN